MIDVPMISIIIPTINEEEVIADTLQVLEARRSETEFEVLISDGGSTDRTLEVVRQRARVVQTLRGRARQLNEGAKAAHGDILFFLHADAQLPAGALTEIERKLRAEGFDGGGFSNVFSSHNERIKLLGRILNLRLKDNDHPANTVFFGDNGIFVRRSVFEALGGFRDLSIMEDYDFSCRMRNSYRVVRITEPRLVVSARRHLKSGFIKTRLQWILIRQLYHAGVSTDLLAALYHDVR